MNRDVNREMVYDAIDDERTYQKSKWNDAPHELGAWILIMQTELAEAQQAWVKNPADPSPGRHAKTPR